MTEPVELLPGHKHGLLLASPVLAAAGSGVRPAAASGLGAVVTRTLTRRPRHPAPFPRFAEVPGGMVHRLHVGNEGLGKALRRRNWAASAVPVIVSVTGTPEDCAHMAGRLDETPGVAGVELSLWEFPPHEVEAVHTHSGLRRTLRVVSAVRVTTSLPVLVKLSPAEPDLASLAQACVEAGADVLVIGGPWPALAPAAKGDELWEGWLSGPALLPLVLLRVRQVAASVTAPVIGCGGVCSPADVRAYLQAGAQAVQVGSAFLVDPAWSRLSSRP